MEDATAGDGASGRPGPAERRKQAGVRAGSGNKAVDKAVDGGSDIADSSDQGGSGAPETMDAESVGGLEVGDRGVVGIAIDPHRAIVFPNRLRELRIAAGHSRLLKFAASIPAIPYIRLSKIE